MTLYQFNIKVWSLPACRDWDMRTAADWMQCVHLKRLLRHKTVHLFRFIYKIPITEHNHLCQNRKDARGTRMNGLTCGQLLALASLSVSTTRKRLFGDSALRPTAQLHPTHSKYLLGLHVRTKLLPMTQCSKNLFWLTVKDKGRLNRTKEAKVSKSENAASALIVSFFTY